ncbi:MAG TPA: Kdo hydroxylase family protein [Burkholderiales bacterium]|nr:Kdo hydroxylase family protein [Burkholderiales bacterium]
MMQAEPLVTLDIASWQPDVAPKASRSLAQALENGKVLCLPRLAFDLSESEQRLLTVDSLDGKRKNITVKDGRLNGFSGDDATASTMKAMLDRYEGNALDLVTRLFPGYRSRMRRAPASFRPRAIDNEPISWRKDDSRLHVDAFPSRPNHGERILRVFTNVNPRGVPRVWRVGEPFEAAATRFLPAIARPFPGSGALLHALGITKSTRSEYDHIMLRMHDGMKADAEFQKNSPQHEVRLAPGTTWICYSDQVLHAVMSGQFMMEQTFHLPVDAQYFPELSPLKTLERLRGRALIG